MFASETSWSYLVYSHLLTEHVIYVPRPSCCGHESFQEVWLHHVGKYLRESGQIERCAHGACRGGGCGSVNVVKCFEVVKNILDFFIVESGLKMGEKTNVSFENKKFNAT